jgi:hypothetical protein
MFSPPSSILRAICLLGLFPVTLLAQTLDPAQPGNEPSYLLRLGRNRNYYEGVCVLLRGDGQYHLEEQIFEKVRVFEGNIDPAELRTLIQIVSGDQLLKLDQKQITDPMLKSDAEQLRLSILRPHNLWQELSFADSQSREPYRQSLLPLLDWLNRIQKREGRKLSAEEGKNNCRPPKKLEFSARPTPVQPDTEQPPRGGNTGAASLASAPQLTAPGAQQKTAVSNSFVLRMLNTESIKSGIAMTCTIVSHAGAYHFVKQSRDFGSRKIRSEVLDGNLTDQQVTALLALLDAPTLVQPPSPPSSSSFSFYMPTAEGPQMTVVVFQRDGVLQKFEAWRGAQVARGIRTAPAPAHGMDALVPLWQWLKINLDESRAVPAESPQNAKCLPESER